VTDELVVGTVRAAEQQPGARAPALLLTLDLGTYGTEEAVIAAGAYEANELLDTQVVCRREADGIVVLAARSHAKGDIPLRPDDDVEPGTLVS
jgi:tRNA-binding EMAP/Myf-like protein